MSEFKILVATNHLESVGGSELYTFDLIKSLNRRGDCSVEYFTFEKGLVSSKIEKELGVHFMTREKYDLIIANHVPVVRQLFGCGPIVQVCHGTEPPLEQPSPYADYHVAVSEEVNLHLKKKNVINSIVILNGLDLEQKRIQKPLNKELKKVLSLCQSESANHIIEDVCEEEGLIFSAFNKHVNPRMNIAEEINNYDMVVGIGRSIYDAMACGRPCVIFDDRDYNGNMGDGYLLARDFDNYVKNNCSGRFSKKKFNKEGLIAEFRKYNHTDGLALRSIAEKELDMAQVGERLLALLHDKRLNSSFIKVKKYFLKFGSKKILRFFTKIPN